MKAAILNTPRQPLEIGELPKPAIREGEVLLRVRACGVCRTDLHIVEGELPPLRHPLIPGHQIVGEIVEGATAESSLRNARGRLVDGRRGRHLPLLPARHGKPVRLAGFHRLLPRWRLRRVRRSAGRISFSRCPQDLDDLHAAPLLCAGIIGFRSLRVAGVEPGDRVGLFGFGASAHLAISVLHAWGCRVYVSTRGESHRKLAASLGAEWVGSETDKPPVALDRAVTFAPSGDVVVAALSSLRKGGVVAINAIHLDRIPEFDYDRLLWGERQIRSVANMTRADARDFLKIASEIGLRPKATAFPLDRANDALMAVKSDRIDGAAVIVP